MGSIIQLILSFLVKHASKWILPVILFILGHRLASNKAKINAQQDQINQEQQTIQTLDRMQRAANKAPADKASLIDQLNKGEF